MALNLMNLATGPAPGQPNPGSSPGGCIGFLIAAALLYYSVNNIQNQVESEELGEMVTIEEQDMYTADLSEIDVVAVYVYSSVLEKLKPQFGRLKPGARIVSHYFEIPGVEPTDVVELVSEETGNTHRILLYQTPLQALEAE